MDSASHGLDGGRERDRRDRRDGPTGGTGGGTGDDGTWTIGELAERAAVALAMGEAEPGARPDAPVRSGRVRDVPTERLIRWYVTIGLVDPPLSRRGRIARYGRRHLLQLVSVKRRQAAGHSLADIQAELTGATDATLRDIAGLPEDPSDLVTPADVEADSPARFWARRPRRGHTTAGRPVATARIAADAAPASAAPASAAPASAAPASAAPASAAPASAAPASAAPASAAPASAGVAGRTDSNDGGGRRGAAPDEAVAVDLVYRLRLAPGVTLLVEAAAANLPGAPSGGSSGDPSGSSPATLDHPAGAGSAGRLPAGDLAELRRAARPLLEALARRGLTHPPDSGAVPPRSQRPHPNRKGITR
jgi:DNA-binding transcriptional MerR regulator